MKRRTFLQFLGLGTAAAPIVVTAATEAAKEAKEMAEITPTANKSMSVQEITRVALRIMHNKCSFPAAGNKWTQHRDLPTTPKTITIKMPTRYKV